MTVQPLSLVLKEKDGVGLLYSFASIPPGVVSVGYETFHNVTSFDGKGRIWWLTSFCSGKTLGEDECGGEEFGKGIAVLAQYLSDNFEGNLHYIFLSVASLNWNIIHVRILDHTANYELKYPFLTTRFFFLNKFSTN